MGTKVTYGTRATCTSQSAPAPPRTRQGPTSASSAAFGPHGHTSRCTHSSPTRVTACTGWCLPTHNAEGQGSAARMTGRINQPAFTILSLNAFPDTRRLTALRHHALLHLGHLSPAHGAVDRGHLHHALASPHPQAAGDAAGVPLGPLCHHAAAGRWTSDKENRISGSGIHTAQEGKHNGVIILL